MAKGGAHGEGVGVGDPRAGDPRTGRGRDVPPPVEGWLGTDAHEERPGGRGEAPGAAVRGYGPEDFPGCVSFHLPASALESYEGRLEFWDGLTETAWKVSEPTTTYHEGPSRRLARVTERLAALRGSPIASFGSSDLVRRDAAGGLRWLMQADEVLYLHPQRVHLGPKIDVDADPLPDIALEVDHSTDVRRRKLGIYQESGFPEIWVLVPWENSRRAPGLAIHVRGETGYAETPESRAFPGWKAEEIHRALTEAVWSAETVRAVERVARAMGAREGTRPEDDPFTRSVTAKAREEGREEARSEILEESVRAVLAGRNIEAALDSPEDRALFGTVPAEVLMAAALACRDEADFRRRVRERITPHTR